MSYIIEQETAVTMLKRQLEIELKAGAEEIIAKAVEEYEKKLRTSLGQTVLTLLERYEIQTDGRVLVIRVETK